MLYNKSYPGELIHFGTKGFKVLSYFLCSINYFTAS